MASIICLTDLSNNGYGNICRISFKKICRFSDGADFVISSKGFFLEET
jgi:hypothetical protein